MGRAREHVRDSIMTLVDDGAFYTSSTIYELLGAESRRDKRDIRANLRSLMYDGLIVRENGPLQPLWRKA